MDVIRAYINGRRRNAQEITVSEFFRTNRRVITGMLYEEMQYVTASGLKKFWSEEFDHAQGQFDLEFNLDYNLITWSDLAREISQIRLNEQMTVAAESLVIREAVENRRRTTLTTDFFQYENYRRAERDPN